MAGRVKPWVWVVVAIFAIGILGVVAMAGAGFYFFSRHIETSLASPSKAATEFETVRARFPEQKPLIELDERGRYVKTNTNRPARSGAPPDQLSVLVYDPKESGRIVRLKIPFWLLRLKLGGTTIDFKGGRVHLEDMKVTVEDLERLGPTLIVDHATPDGERVLVWSQ
jgi:hypothetical protein